MLKIYSSSSCPSCRKVKAWFDKRRIPYQEINILKHPLTTAELKEMLNKSLDGTDEIISTRSKIFKESNIDIDSMSLNELCDFIKDHPTILKRPIIVDTDKIQVGYNSDEIEIFEKLKDIREENCNTECANYDECHKDIEAQNFSLDEDDGKKSA